MFRYQLAYRTRYHEQNLNPKWKPFEIHIDQLCYGDKDREFLVECFDWDKDGKLSYNNFSHDLVGSCRTTVNRLLNKEDVTLPLINQKKMKKNKKYVDSGQLHFHRVYCWMDYTFLDFITGGTELEFTVAIDFTKSNLPSGNMASLHHVDDENSSQYEIAIQAVAEICQYYNNSQLFYAYGFGARLPGDNRVNFHFPLNLITNSPECIGMNGLLDAYRDALNRIELAGPTEFGPTLRYAARHAASLPPDGSRYSVLLIITDGVINDMNRAKEEIVKASSLPLSIIIVGVGYDSFGEMKVLDSDRQMLQVNGKYAKRDIVQFVQLREFLPPHRILTEDDLIEAKYRLAKEVLQEVPAQLTSYMKSKGIFPKEFSPFPSADERKLSAKEQKYPSPQTTSRTRRRMLPAVPCEEVQDLHINPTKSV
ncbi:unnamed protein product [Onchocerca ochengi]|uniref:VWFA domain-containing protein n=1 Tax=Onchocerca ochengi TaxID=42157 RepID=A0A182E8Y4_ONCOC|nr:unnamed protein product [Onchocerca ochengi]